MDGRSLAWEAIAIRHFHLISTRWLKCSPKASTSSLMVGVSVDCQSILKMRQTSLMGPFVKRIRNSTRGGVGGREGQSYL